MTFCVTSNPDIDGIVAKSSHVLQLVCSVWSWYNFKFSGDAPQTLQLVCPTWFWNWPCGQTLQPVGFLTAGDALPVSQLLHDVADAAFIAINVKCVYFFKIKQRERRESF